MKSSTRFISTARPALALIAAVALSGCASSGYHFSQIEGSRYFKTNIDTFPVVVTQVDGRSPAIGITPVLVLPGQRMITVQGAAAPVNLQTTVDFPLDVKPCTRYYLVAVKQSQLVNDFSVRIDYQEPVMGCTPPPEKSAA